MIQYSIKFFREITICQLQIIDIAISIKNASKSEISVIKPLTKEMVNIKRQNKTDKPNESHFELNKRSDNPAETKYDRVVQKRTTGHLLTSVMHMIAIDNMFKY